jgi:hypothetical protein
MGLNRGRHRTENRRDSSCALAIDLSNEPSEPSQPSPSRFPYCCIFARPSGEQALPERHDRIRLPKWSDSVSMV